MNIVDEYFLQRFPNKDTGKLETDKPYQCRICWYKLGYPSAEELEKHCNSTASSINKYMSLYGWTAIKEHAINLQAKQDQIDLRKRQKETEEKHRQRNNKLATANEHYLDSLLEKLEDPEFSPEQLTELMIEIRKTRYELSSIQRDERTTEHLPNSYKDVTGEINLDANANVKSEVTVNLLDKVKEKRRELNDLHSSEQS